MNENNKDVIIESLKRKVKRLEHEQRFLKPIKSSVAEVYKKF